jgi:hypothetical protein
LWLAIGSNSYETETKAKYTGPIPPPPAARPIPKWEDSKLPFHAGTTYRETVSSANARIITT